MKNKFRLFNIEWDTDSGNDEGDDNLPSLPKEDCFSVDSDFDVSLYGADLLSDKYGWCVNSFEFERIS